MWMWERTVTQGKMDKRWEREYTMNYCGKQYKDTDLEKTSAYTTNGE